MTASLDCYLNEKFPELKLESPLFYNADIGIRFEIGNPDPMVSEEKYKEQVRFRSTQLFKNVHSDRDDLYIAVFLSFQKTRMPYKLKVFKNGVKNKRTLEMLTCNSITLPDEEDDGWLSYRYILHCKVSDIKPEIFLFSDYRIFFVNITRNTIFYFYDSRDLDIVSNSTSALQDIYFNYHHWILDYDRERIDCIFSNGKSCYPPGNIDLS